MWIKHGFDMGVMLTKFLEAYLYLWSKNKFTLAFE